MSPGGRGIPWEGEGRPPCPVPKIAPLAAQPEMRGRGGTEGGIVAQGPQSPEGEIEQIHLKQVFLNLQLPKKLPVYGHLGNRSLGSQRTWNPPSCAYNCRRDAWRELHHDLCPLRSFLGDTVTPVRLPGTTN